MKTYSVKLLLKLLILLYPTLPISIFSIISNGIAKSATERLLCRLRPPAQNTLSSVATLLQLLSSHYVLLLPERALLRRLRSQWTPWFRGPPHSRSLLQPCRLAYFRTSVPNIPLRVYAATDRLRIYRRAQRNPMSALLRKLRSQWSL